jgi:hypothetical protein
MLFDNLLKNTNLDSDKREEESKGIDVKAKRSIQSS